MGVCGRLPPLKQRELFSIQDVMGMQKKGWVRKTSEGTMTMKEMMCGMPQLHPEAMMMSKILVSCMRSTTRHRLCQQMMQRHLPHHRVLRISLGQGSS